jgi:hypothetical protein
MAMFYNFSHTDQDLIDAQVDHLKKHMGKYIAAHDEKGIRKYVLSAFDSWDPRLAMIHPGVDIIVKGMKMLREEFGYKLRVLPDGNIEFKSGRNTYISTQFHGKKKDEIPECAKSIWFHLKHRPMKVMEDYE